MKTFIVVTEKVISRGSRPMRWAGPLSVVTPERTIATITDIAVLGVWHASTVKAALAGLND